MNCPNLELLAGSSVLQFEPPNGPDFGVWVLIKDFNLLLIGFCLIYRCNWESRMVGIIAVIVVCLFVYRLLNWSPSECRRTQLLKKPPNTTLNFMFSISVLNCVWWVRNGLRVEFKHSLHGWAAATIGFLLIPSIMVR